MTNRFFTVFICGLLCTATMTAQAQSGTTGNLTWNIKNGTLTISGIGKMPDYPYKYVGEVNTAPWGKMVKKITTVVIENGVTSIGEYAFHECRSLTSVIIPNSATSIGKSAFGYCSDLTSVTIPTSVTSIGEYTFVHCRSLTSVTIPNSVTSIGGNAFSNCNNLASVIIPNSVTFIGGYAFSDCSNLTSVIIPNSVTSIENGVFRNCSNLTSVTIPNSVTSIGINAFVNCRSLTSVPIPHSVAFIGDYVFLGCDNLTSVILGDKVFAMKSREFNMDFVLKNRKILYSYFSKNYVESRINDWQKKGEFESTFDWQKRVNENTRQAKVVELLKDTEAAFIAERSKSFNMGSMTLDAYDADNQTYLIKNSEHSNWLVPVPIGEAPTFKNNWESVKKTPKYAVVDDQLAIAEMTFTIPNGKIYKYSNQASLNYTIAKIDYNFASIDINIADNSTTQRGQQNISTTNITTGNLSDVDINIPVNTIKNDKTFVVIIANEDYQESGISRVEFAKNDGSIFKEYCIKTMGLPEHNVHYRANATLNNMRAEIKWIKDLDAQFKNKTDINIIFYYSGHGTNDELSKSAYLLPTDGLAEDAGTAYKLDDLYQILGNLSAKSVTVFLDACYSGAGRDGSMLVASKGVVIKAKQGVPIGNTVVFSSSQGDETSFPYKEKEHGLFTYFLLKKLQETKGDVTLGELGNYVTDKVGQQSVVVNRKSQTPTVISSTSLINWENLKLK